MSKIPALREQLQVAAERRYGRTRWKIRGQRALAPATTVMVCTLLAGVFLIGQRGSGDNLERAATPNSESYTARITHPSSSPMAVLDADVLDAAATEKALTSDGGAGASGKLQTAWIVRDLSGHVYLLRKGTDWCLSVPDPYGGSPGDRGVTCASDRTYHRYGVSLRVGNTFAAVIPQDHPSPTLRTPEGVKSELRPSAGGLVVISNVENRAAVLLESPDGTTQTNRLRVEPVVRYECTDGRVLTPEVVTGDPCAPLSVDGDNQTNAPLTLQGRGG